MRQLHLGSGEYSDAGLKHLAALPALEDLNLISDRVTDAGMAELANMPALENLNIPHCPVSDAGLAALAKAPALRQLLLNGTKVSWQGLRHLCAFPRLDDLDITTGLEGRPSLEHLQDLTALRSLDLYLREPGLAPAELAHLHGLTKLKHLSLTGHVPVSDEAMKHLVNLHELEYLVLWPDSGAITDAGLSHLAGMQRLEYLQISGRITDAGLEHLAKLGSLKSLNLNTRTVTSEALAALRQRLPSLQSVTVPTGPPLKEMPKVGDAAPALVAKTFDGQTFTLAQQRGKVVLLYFWGTWCSPCVGSTPRLKVLHDELAREHGERFTMLSLSFNEASFLPRRHAERHQLGWPQTALGDDSQTQVAYGVWGAPTYFLIGPDGTVASTARDWDQIKRDVASILGGGK